MNLALHHPIHVHPAAILPGEGAGLDMEGAPSVGALLSMQPVVLRSGPLYRCERCNTRFASAAEAKPMPKAMWTSWLTWNLVAVCSTWVDC